MQDRCYNEKNIRYKDWGGRGIQVCDEWRNSFTAFEIWALNNDYSAELSIDRIDNNSNYCLENCRWATLEEQANNKSNNRYVTINNEIKTVTQRCKKYNVKPSLARNRIDILNWDPIKALTM